MQSKVEEILRLVEKLDRKEIEELRELATHKQYLYLGYVPVYWHIETNT